MKMGFFKFILRRTKTKNNLPHLTVVFVIHLYCYVRFLRDRFITTVNVLGDAMGTGIVEHLSRDDLRSTGDDDASVLKPLRTSENEAELQHFSNV